MHFHPQVKALLHEGPEASHRRSLIPPVTFEVRGRGLGLHSWGLTGFLVPWSAGFWLSREPNHWLRWAVPGTHSLGQ